MRNYTNEKYIYKKALQKVFIKGAKYGLTRVEVLQGLHLLAIE